MEPSLERASIQYVVIDSLTILQNDLRRAIDNARRATQGAHTIGNPKLTDEAEEVWAALEAANLKLQHPLIQELIEDHSSTPF